VDVNDPDEADWANNFIAYHAKPHLFRFVGRRHHIQLLRYIKGKPVATSESRSLCRNSEDELR
jgi:hypothetical protein